MQKTLVFSDTHFRKDFDLQRYNFLTDIIANANRVIINGDLWDGYYISFDQFINSQWNKLFPLLKKKKTVYLFGNHDKKEWCDERINLFASEAHDSYKLPAGDKTLLIEHGHRLVPGIVERYPWILNPLTKTARRIADDLGYKLIGHKKIELSPKARNFNDIATDWALKNSAKNEIFVTSHSHLGIMDLKNRFINTGSIGHGFTDYLLIQGSKIELIHKRY